MGKTFVYPHVKEPWELYSSRESFSFYYLYQFHEYQQITERALFLKIHPATLYAYYILREIACQKGRPGWIPRNLARKIIQYYFNVVTSTAYAYLRRGQNIFWHTGSNKAKQDVLYIHSPRHVAHLFKIRTPLTYYLVKLSVLLQKTKIKKGGHTYTVYKATTLRLRAHAFKIAQIRCNAYPAKPYFQKVIHYHNGRPVRDPQAEYYNRKTGAIYSEVCRKTLTAVKPISRRTLQRRTRVDPTTQRRYEDNCRRHGDPVYINTNYSIDKELSPEEFYRLSRLLAEGFPYSYKGYPLNRSKYQLRRFAPTFIGVAPDVSPYYVIVRQLPNSYSAKMDGKGRYLLPESAKPCYSSSHYFNRGLTSFCQAVGLSLQEFESLQVIELQEVKNPFVFGYPELGRARIRRRRWKDRKGLREHFTLEHCYRSRKRYRRTLLWQSHDHQGRLPRAELPKS